jgi:hypothetical protein
MRPSPPGLDAERYWQSASPRKEIPDWPLYFCMLLEYVPIQKEKIILFEISHVETEVGSQKYQDLNMTVTTSFMLYYNQDGWYVECREIMESGDSTTEQCRQELAKDFFVRIIHNYSILGFFPYRRRIPDTWREQIQGNLEECVPNKVVMAARKKCLVDPDVRSRKKQADAKKERCCNCAIL